MSAIAAPPGHQLVRSRRSIAALLGLLAAAGTVLTAAPSVHAATGFTAGDIVVYRVGTGTGALGSGGAAVFLDEYTPSGAFVESVPLPTSTSGSNKPLVASGTATSEGLLTLSPNGQFLAATGYDAAVGTTKVGSTTSTATPRTVAIINAAGTVNTTTALTDAATGNNVRSAVTSDGTNIWVGGAAGGVRSTTIGSSTSTEIVSDPPTGTSYKNVREVNIANGQLYTSADPTKAGIDIATVGTGLPTSGSLTPANLPGLPTSGFDPYGYSFLTLGTGSAPDTMYVADNTAGAVDKFALVSGTWTAAGSVSVPGVIGVAANDDGNGNVTIDASASNSAGTSGTLSVITDTSGLGGTLTGSATTPVTLPANETFRGVAFAPGTVLGSGGGVKPPPAVPTISVAHSGLPAAINDPTNPTDAIAVGDANFAASQLTVTATSSSTSVAPQSGISVTGTGPTRTLTVTPGTSVGYSTITLTVSAPDGTQASTTVTYGLSANLGDASDRYFSGAGNGSTAIDVGGGYMIVGDDESNVLRLYNETQSGPPAKTFDFTGQLPDGTTEVDIEASARAGNTLYWLGSMSNSSGGNVEPARSTLFAATISGSGASTSLTYLGAYTGLQTDLVNWDNNNGSGLGANYFGFDQSVNGGAINHAINSLEVEGLEFAHGSSTTAYLAFRGPIEPASNRQDALMIPLTNINQLVTGGATHATFGAPILWNLGGLGIREIRANADGTYLLIAGTADGTNSSFVLYRWDGNVNDTPLPTNTPLPLIPSGQYQGSWESIVSVPDPLSAGTSVQLLEDNGDTAWYGDGATSKDTLPADLQKDLGRVFTYSPPAPNTVTITAADEQMVFGSPDPTFGFTATGVSGSDAITTAPTCGVAGSHTAAGTYAITCSGAVTSNPNGTDQIVYVAGTLTVSKSPAVVGLVADNNPAVTGQAVTFTATVSAPGVSAVPTGTVEFSVAGSDLAGCSAVAVDGSGHAVCADEGDLPAGHDTVTATYSGDANFASATTTVVVEVTPATYLFVNENPNGANEVRNYRVNGDGTTTLVGSYATGHPGDDASWVAAGRGALAQTAGYLYALNLGDQTVSVFAVDPSTGVLTLEGSTASLDASSIAVNPAGTVLYAAGSTNTGSANQLSSYTIGADGMIDPTPVATVAADADGLAVSPDGTEIAAAYPGTSPIDPNVAVWATDSSGDLTAVATTDQTCPTDVRFVDSATLVSASCYAGPLTAYAVGSGQLTATGTAVTASQTLAVGPDGTVYFDTAAGLQGAEIGSGSITTGPTTAYPASDSITSMAVSPDGSRLFVASFDGTAINDYSIGAGDSLTLVDQIPVPAALLPSLVAYTPTEPSGQTDGTSNSAIESNIKASSATQHAPRSVKGVRRRLPGATTRHRGSKRPARSAPAHRGTRWTRPMSRHPLPVTGPARRDPSLRLLAIFTAPRSVLT
jgi:hypothetical protein